MKLVLRRCRLLLLGALALALCGCPIKKDGQGKAAGAGNAKPGAVKPDPKSEPPAPKAPAPKPKVQKPKPRPRPVPLDPEAKKAWKEILALEEDAEFSKALRKAKDLKAKLKGHPKKKELQRLIRRLIEEDEASVGLDYAMNNLTAKSGVTRRVARNKIKAAGRAGQIVLYKALRETDDLNLLPQITRILRNSGDVQAGPVFLKKLETFPSEAVRKEVVYSLEVIVKNHSHDMVALFLLDILRFGNRLKDPDQSAQMRLIGRHWSFGRLPPKMLEMFYQQVKTDRDFSKRHIVEFFGHLYKNKAGGQAKVFEAMFPEGSGRLKTLREYTAKATSSLKPQLMRWGTETGILLDQIRAKMPGFKLEVYFRFDEEMGKSIDRSGMNNHGRNFNLKGSTDEGICGNSREFTGTDQWVELPARPNMASFHQGNFSYSIWIKPKGMPENVQPDPYWLIIGRPGAGGHSGLRLTSRQTVSLIHFLDGPKKIECEYLKRLKPDKWTHLVGVVDRGKGQVKLYINGALQKTVRFRARSPVDSEQHKQPLRIGLADAQAEKNRCRYRGLIDEVALYSRALRDKDVAAIYCYILIRKNYAKKTAY